MTGGNAGFAAGALIEVDLEGVLLAVRGRGGGEQVLITATANGGCVMRAGKHFHRRQRALFREQLVHERARGRRAGLTVDVSCGNFMAQRGAGIRTTAPGLHPAPWRNPTSSSLGSC